MEDTPTPGRPVSNSDHERMRIARERVSEIKGFYIHLTVFVAVLVLLFIVNAATGDAWWVQWVLLGWGIGVVLHAVAIFGQSPSFLSKWEKRKIREYMDKG